MNVSWPAARRWLASAQVVRRGAEVLFRGHCRHLLQRLDHLDATRCQLRTLLRLVHGAFRTPFGREHDFARIRTLGDFRRLVPLRTAQELRRFPVAPVVPAADAARLAAVTTGLALAARETPLSHLFGGTVLLLGDDLALPDDPRRVLPALVRPYANVRGKVACLVGSADRLARYLEVCRPDDRVSTRAVLYTDSPGIEVDRIRSRLSRDAVLLQLVFRPEGPVAVEDTRRRCHRLLVDHGVFFEFVPADERTSHSPSRLTLDRVKPGAVYELIQTAPGGWWACRTGIGVCFERREQALVQFVPLPTAAVPVITPPTVAAPIRETVPNPRTSGIPAALPESFAHTPW